MSEFLGVFVWKLGLEVRVPQWRPARSCSGERLQRCVVLTVIWSLLGPGLVILVQVGVWGFLGPVEADVLLCCPWVWDSEELLISLTDAEVLLGGAPDGGLGLGWHRGGGGCGLWTDEVLRACRVSSETRPADSLGKRNQNGNQIEIEHFRVRRQQENGFSSSKVAFFFPHCVAGLTGSFYFC